MKIPLHHPIRQNVEVGQKAVNNWVLPGDEHVYGYKPKEQKEGVKEGIFNKSFTSHWFISKIRECWKQKIIKRLIDWLRETKGENWGKLFRKR